MKRKKMYEAESNKQQNMLNELEKQKLTLEAAEDTSAVFETLSLATATSKEAIRQGVGDSMSIEELKDDQARVESELEQIDQLFHQDGSSETDQELLRQLEELSLQEADAEGVNADQDRLREQLQRQEAEKLD